MQQAGWGLIKIDGELGDIDTLDPQEEEEDEDA